MTDKMAAELELIDWIKREMPAGTVIGNPEWWASRIAYRARSLTAPRVPDGVAPHCDYGYITPAKGNSWFAYDPAGDGMLFFETEEEARAASQKSVDLSLDEFWSEDVDRICYGRVTHAATQVGRSDRPGLDEDGYDEDGEYWPADCEFKCNYELHPLTAAPAPADSGEYGDAYQGAREDLAIWKRRALAAEKKIREQDEVIGNLANAINAENGTMFMGEPSIHADSALERLRERVKVLEAQLEPDMFWDADDPECFRGSDIEDAIRDIMDQAILDDGEWIDITLQRAASLSNLRVKARYVSDCDIEYEEIGRDAASLRGGSDE